MNDLMALTNKLENISIESELMDAETSKSIAEFERLFKKMEDFKKSYRENILEQMKKKNIKKIVTDDIAITYKDSYDKEYFDKKKFRAENPDIHDKYVSMRTSKASIDLRLNKND